METLSMDVMLRVQRELGSITESLRQGEDHRREIIQKLDKQDGRMETMSGQMNELSQSSRSQSAVLQPLLLDNCGKRLTDLEGRLEDYEDVRRDLQFWHRLMGGGMKGMSKLILAIISSGSVGAGAVELLHTFWPHTFQ